MKDLVAMVRRKNVMLIHLQQAGQGRKNRVPRQAAEYAG